MFGTHVWNVIYYKKRCKAPTSVRYQKNMVLTNHNGDFILKSNHSVHKNLKIWQMMKEFQLIDVQIDTCTNLKIKGARRGCKVRRPAEFWNPISCNTYAVVGKIKMEKAESMHGMLVCKACLLGVFKIIFLSSKNGDKIFLCIDIT